MQNNISKNVYTKDTTFTVFRYNYVINFPCAKKKVVYRLKTKFCYFYFS